MGGPRKPKEVTAMKKPKWKVGERVTFKFLGSEREGEILTLAPNPHHIERWVYKIRDTKGTIIPYVGVDDSEPMANIYTEKYLKEIAELSEEDLDDSKE